MNNTINVAKDATKITTQNKTQNFSRNANGNKPLIVFTGGGTGGHVYPNLALIPIFERRGFRTAYMGGEGDTIEKRLAIQQGIPYYGVPNIKLIRSLSPKALKNNLRIPSRLSAAVKAAQDILKKLSPKVVFSKGGFAALPITLAAQRLNIPVFCHESDYTLGLANRIAASKGAIVFKANPESQFNGVFSGMPLREKLFSAQRTSARAKLKIPNGKKVLLVIGGSSGASALNEAVLTHLDALCKKFYVLHITGKGKQEGLPTRREGYAPFDYADNIEDFYAAADVILSRAGATAVYEISALQKRVVFVPLPKQVSRGDQLYNAALAEKYGAVVLKQDKQFIDNFLGAITTAANNPPMRAIINDANGKIADIVCARLRRGEICIDKKPLPNGSP